MRQDGAAEFISASLTQARVFHTGSCTSPPLREKTFDRQSRVISIAQSFDEGAVARTPLSARCARHFPRSGGGS